MRRGTVSFIGALLAVFVIYTSPATASTADGFIREMGSKAFSALGEEGISDQERENRFRSLLKNAFDLPRIARFVLGRYWRRASEAEQKEFVDLFEKFVVQAYATRFRDLSGKKLIVMQARELSAKQALVLSRIDIPGQPSVKINWRVRNKDANFKIVDVMVEGISMSVTQRDEFAAVIRQTGGRVEGLLRALRKKTASK